MRLSPARSRALLRAPVALAWVALALPACGARTPIDTAAPRQDAATTATDASPDTSVTQRCGYATATPLASVRFDTGGFAADLWLTALVPAGDQLVIGAQIQDGTYNGDGFLQRVATVGGPLVDVTGLGTLAQLEDYAGGTVVTDGARLYYAHPTFPPGTISYPTLVSRPVTGGAETTLPTPTPPTASVTAIAIVSGGGVAWATYNETGVVGASFLVHADGGTTALHPLPGIAYGMFVVQGFVYVATPKGLYRTDLQGAPAALVHASSQNAGLLAANSAQVFFTPDGTTILAVDAASGAETTLATGLTIGLGTIRFGDTPLGHADDRAIYVPTPQGIVSIPATGGSPQVIVPPPPASAGPFNAIAGDACNLYWGYYDIASSSEPIFAVAKPR